MMFLLLLLGLSFCKLPPVYTPTYFQQYWSPCMATIQDYFEIDQLMIANTCTDQKTYVQVICELEATIEAIDPWDGKTMNNILYTNCSTGSAYVGFSYIENEPTADIGANMCLRYESAAQYKRVQASIVNLCGVNLEAQLLCYKQSTNDIEYHVIKVPSVDLDNVNANIFEIPSDMCATGTNIWIGAGVVYSD